MARPIKDGIDYFSFDVNFFSDSKIKVVKSQYGADGVLLYIYLLCEVYRHKGYYAQVDKDFEYIAADDLHMSSEKIGQIMNFLLGRSLFEDTLFKSDKVLTSRGIQLRYQEAVKTRATKKPVTVDGKLWLLNEEETQSFIKVRHFENYSEKNMGYSVKNGSYSEEKHTKESKEKKSKGNETTAPRMGAEEQAPIQEIYDLYNAICGEQYRKVTNAMNYQRERRIMVLWREYGDMAVFRTAFEKAVKSDFLLGGWKEGGKADFDWMLQQAHFVSLLEGKYDNREKKRDPTSTYDLEELESILSQIPEVGT